uniref:Uncharacterized protein n=1 Tax=Rhizophora mucronata TaxID=61149 RepID=A0A2P2NX52_RHIMU
MSVELRVLVNPTFLKFKILISC